MDFSIFDCINRHINKAVTIIRNEEPKTFFK